MDIKIIRKIIFDNSGFFRVIIKYIVRMNN